MTYLSSNDYNFYSPCKSQVAAPARAGAIAPVDVIVEAQNTGMGPEKTSFFQALNISTKIARGSIEIVVSILFRHPFLPIF